MHKDDKSIQVGSTIGLAVCLFVYNVIPTPHEYMPGQEFKLIAVIGAMMFGIGVLARLIAFVGGRAPKRRDDD